MRRSTKTACWALTLAVLAATPAPAAEPDADPHQLEVAGFPVVGYNSDHGLALGLLGTLTRLHPDYDPHRWRLDGLAVVSVREDEAGDIEASRQKYDLELDLPQFPTRALRLRLRPYFVLLKVANYYGLGNDSPDWDGQPEDVHQFEHLDAGLEAELRWAMTDALSLFGRARGAYDAVQVYPGSALARDRADPAGPDVRGVAAHDLAVLRLGALWDTRDDENDPTTGSFHELSARVGGSVVDDFAYTGAHVQGRWYLPVWGEHLTLATRAVADLLGGHPPIYQLIWLGGDFNLRGVPEGRFAGKVRLLGTAELRARFGQFRVLGPLPMRAGVVAFVDTGRVFADYADDPALDGEGLGLKVGTGGGLRLRWGTSFVARGDVAWSPDGDGLGVYIGVEHVF
ncbi:MAG: BamA/TamA family outer membrane protein [Myxococcales bacterium]|nr:BamA/TamA family outer membrane protein [Myxococcales bacterium]